MSCLEGLRLTTAFAFLLFEAFEPGIWLIKSRHTYSTPVSRHPKPLRVLAFNRKGSTA
jgi:hypothetical protein